MRTFVCRGTEQLGLAAQVIAGLSSEKPWRITLTPHRARRSHEQNALLWALYTEIASGTGHTAEEVHEAAKKLLLAPKTVVIGDLVVDVVGSSAELDPMAFSEFLERVQEWAAREFGVVLE